MLVASQLGHIQGHQGPMSLLLPSGLNWAIHLSATLVHLTTRQIQWPVFTRTLKPPQAWVFTLSQLRLSKCQEI